MADLAPFQRLGYVLYGGTAVALHLGHRRSIDFDFFTDRVMDREALIEAAPFLSVAETLQDADGTWSVLTTTQTFDERPVKLSFFAGLGFGRVGHPRRSDGGELLIASLRDLFGHKLKVLLQRVEAKDYQDIVAILQSGMTLDTGIGAAMALFPPAFPASEALRALVYFEGGDLHLLPAATRATLVAHADSFTAPSEVSIISKHLAP